MAYLAASLPQAVFHGLVVLLQGYVLDKDGKPLPNTWVYVDGQSMMGTGTATDSTGHFAFWPLRRATMLAATNHVYWVSKIPITDTPITIRMTPKIEGRK